MTLEKAERPGASWGVPQELHRHSNDGAKAQPWTEDLAGSMADNPEAAKGSCRNLSASTSMLDSDSGQTRGVGTSSSGDEIKASRETSHAAIQLGPQIVSPLEQGGEEGDLPESSDSMVRTSAPPSATKYIVYKLPSY